MTRRLGWLLLPIVGAVLLLGGGLWSFSPMPAVVEDPIATAPVEIQLSSQSKTPDEVVAWVNGQPLDRVQLQIALGVERAMETLLGVPAPDSAVVVDQLVNSELVWQAAQEAGFSLAEGQRSPGLERFLSAQGKSPGELEGALSAYGVKLEDFESYYERLLVVDQFSQAQAAARELSIEDYLVQLQQSAKIYLLEEEIDQVINAAVNMPEPSHAATDVHAEDAVAVLSPEDYGTGVGQYAPAFTLPLLYAEGSRTTLSLDDLHGKPVLLSFWSRACGHCQVQTPVLVDAWTRYGDNVQFVGVSIAGTSDEVSAYVEAQQIQYPVLLDPDQAVVRAYGVTGVPTTFFLDAEGRVVSTQVGALSPEEVDVYLEQMLASSVP